MRWRNREYVLDYDTGLVIAPTSGRNNEYAIASLNTP
jgi:hypothetical protein